MKFYLILLFVCTIGYAQTDSKDQNSELNEVKLTNINVSVSVDSAEDVKSTFDVKDIAELVDLAEPNETLVFELKCEDGTVNSEKNYVSYRVKGNSSDSESFLKRVEKVKQAAIKYYKNKN
ncbi:hypothetical protein AB9K26_04170 [Psychroserpens sp. XS_ASV72]|uniref:hypothetical protein n=1 Tax=Psychroserpens sp. XS_ASV72 TaxID=3241293 RepID=UPI00351280EB